MNCSGDDNAMCRNFTAVRAPVLLWPSSHAIVMNSIILAAGRQIAHTSE